MRRFPLALVVLLAGCAGYKPPAPPAPRDATDVNASAGVTWDAVVDLLASRNIPIRTLERVSGFVATEQLAVDSRDGGRWADCGRRNGGRLGPNRGTYNVLIRGDSVHSTVKATVRWTDVEGGETYECTTTHVWEQAFESQVRNRAETSAVASSSRTQYAAPAAPPEAGAAPSTGSSDSGGHSHNGAAIAADSAGGFGRSKTELLSFEPIRRAIGDLERKNLLLTFRESGYGRLELNMPADALNEPTLEYLVTRLFLAYGESVYGDARPTVVLRTNGQQVGLYTRAGLRWTAEAGRS